MKLLERLLGQRKLVLTLSLLLSLLGCLFWFKMARQEDPRMPDYWGQVVVSFPGADAETVERLVLEPLEEQLASVDEIKELSSTAFAELAMLKIDLADGVDDTDRAWDEIREALADVRTEFPAGVGEPRLNDELQDNESIVYALSGHPDPLVLARAAETLKNELLALPHVSEVTLIADPEEQVVIELDDANARRLGLDARHFAAQLGQRSLILPGGSIALDGRTVALRPVTEFESLEEIRATPITLPDGTAVPLAAVARVRLGPEEPIRSLMRFNGEASVGVGVVPRRNDNVLEFGRRVRELVAREAAALAPVEVEEVIFQPDRVEARLDDLSRSLILGIVIVAGVLMLAMGLRMGLIVASVVPLVVFSSVAIYAIGGGVLHQISIAAIVIALGMLVDNAIVVAEGIQWRLDRGLPRHQAAVDTVRDLAVPLASATLTTLAAFVPMLLAEGGTGEFTRAIPILIMLTLSLSYAFAIFVTPALAESILRPHGAGDDGGLLVRIAGPVGRFAVRRSRWVLGLATAAVVVSVLGAGGLERQFFPSSDRNQLVVDVRLPEGSHLEATDREAQALEQALLEHPQVVSVASFVGRSTPKFYYNLHFIPWSPHLAQLVVDTTSTGTLDPVIAWLRERASSSMPGVELIVRKLEQGPSIEAPVEIRLYGEDLAALHAGAEMVLAEVEAIPGTTDTRQSLGSGAPTLRFHVDDAAAARRGLDRTDVAMALYGHTRGVPVGEYRAEDDPIPVVVRTSEGERLPLAALTGLDVAAPGGVPVPLSQVARMNLEWRPAAIHHYAGRRVARVLSELEGTTSYSEVVATLGPRLASLDLPPGVRWEVGGAVEGSGEANLAMMRALPVGIMLLLGILMAEFRSFRRVGIVLVTVPLAAAGVVPGLLIGGQPFGFMSMLGVFSLVGVVVNNAIILLEVIESRRQEGASIEQAVADSVERRLRPIVLTSATTIAGLIPLAFSSSTLWPPMAWAMISGLLVSTFLTVLVVPGLYLVLFRERQPREQTFAAPVTALILAMLLVGAWPAFAGEDPERLDLPAVMERAAGRPGAVAAAQRAKATDEAAEAERRQALWPALEAGLSFSDRTEDLELVTPIGDFEFGDSRSDDAEILVVQPLLDPVQRFHLVPAARERAQAAHGAALRAVQLASAAAADAYLDVLASDAALAATTSFIASLEARLAETEARVEAGRALAADGLKVRLALDSALQERLELEQARQLDLLRLGVAIGVDGPVEPSSGAPETVPGAPSFDAALAVALDARADLAALAAEERALELRRSAVTAERLPKLQASARWVWSSGSPYRQEQWVEGRLGVRWAPFAAGTRAPRVAALTAELAAHEAELVEARRVVELELRAAFAALATARGAVRVGESGVAQATETLRVERERHQAGRATTNELLAAEAALRDQRTRWDLARIALLRAWIHLSLAQGATSGAGLLPGE